MPGHEEDRRSLPDNLFVSVNDLAKRQGMSRSELFAVALADRSTTSAKRQGMSRSELFAVALAEYLARHGEADITSKLHEVLADEPSGLDPALRTAQARSVGLGGLR